MVIESDMVLCVRTNSRRHWIPVPTKKRGREPSVTFGCSQKWLQQVLVGGRTDRDAHDVSLVMTAFEQQVRAHIGSTAQASSACSQKKTVILETPRKRRLRLLGSSDDEGESAKPITEGSDSASSPTANKSKTQKSSAVIGFRTVPLGDDEVEIGFYKGPGLLVKPKVGTVQRIIQHLDNNYGTLLAAGRNFRARQSESRKGGPHELLDSRWGSNGKSTAGVDSKKIRFDFRRGAYLIMYKGEAGEARQLSKGLEVPRTDYIGNVLRGDAYSQAKAQVLIKARLKWNTLDRSGAPRFPADDGVPQPQP